MKVCKNIESLQELSEEFDIPNTDGDNPCYQVHISNTEELSRKVSVTEYLELLCSDRDEVALDNLVTFSVSSQEGRHQEWLDAIAMYPGSHITSIERKGYVGGYKYNNYTVYFCSFPVTPQFPE